MTICKYFLKTNTCRYNIDCTKEHISSTQTRICVLKNIYKSPDLSSVKEYNLYTNMVYDDILFEMNTFGRITNFILSISKHDILHGTVYVEYSDIISVENAINNLTDRTYSYNPIICERGNMTSITDVLCNIKDCDSCWYIHPYIRYNILV